VRISVRTKPGARVESVERVDDTHFVVAVRERPIEGRANQAVVAALARHFNIAPSRIRIVSGAGGRNKIVDVEF